MSTEPNKPDSKDPAISMRMLLAFALTGLVIFGTPYFYKAVGIKVPEKTEQPATAPQNPAVTPASPAPTPAAARTPLAGSSGIQHQAVAEPVAASAGSIMASSEEAVTLDTDLYRVVFSNRGGVAKSWTLKKFPDHAGKPLDVVNTAAVQKAGYPFEYQFRNAKPPVDLNQALYKATQSPDGLGVTFEYTNGGVTARKSFTFQRDSYLLQVDSAVAVNGQPLPHLLAWRGGFGDMAVPNAASQENEVYYDSASDKIDREKCESRQKRSADEGRHFRMGRRGGSVFCRGVSARGQRHRCRPLSSTTRSKTPFNNSEEAFVGLAVGGDGENRLSLYLGPKDPETLRKLNPKAGIHRRFRLVRHYRQTAVSYRCIG